MAGYAAMARIDHARPRFLPGRPLDGADGVAWAAASIEAARETVLEDIAGEPFGARLADLLADIREVWRQGIDVLNDPQGYR